MIKRTGKGWSGATAHRKAAGRDEAARGRTETRRRRRTPGRRRDNRFGCGQDLAAPTPRSRRGRRGDHGGSLFCCSARRAAVHGDGGVPATSGQKTSLTYRRLEGAAAWRGGTVARVPGAALDVLRGGKGVVASIQEGGRIMWRWRHSYRGEDDLQETLLQR
jgi:hypothetical protein